MSVILWLGCLLPACDARHPALVVDGGPVNRLDGLDSLDSPSTQLHRDSSPATPMATWVCNTKIDIISLPGHADHRTICHTSEGLPEGSGFRCNQSGGPSPTWVCYGQASGGGGGGWSCVFVEAVRLSRCTKPVEWTDHPPGSEHWACWKSSLAGGTLCEKLDAPTTLPVDPPDRRCHLGQRMWCEGLSYGPWGMVTCDPLTLRWKTVKNSAGQELLDCRESPDGRQPDTLCSCYHFFFNPACCERPDCVVPDGTDGARCAPGPGGLCSYCNPMQSECKEAGARCITTNMHETFCARLCNAAAPCPAGFQCMTVKLNGDQTTQQCVPEDYSCYY